MSNKDNLARRLADMNATLHNLKATVLTMDRMRTDLLQQIATLCKCEGFDVSVVPNGGDFTLSIAWEKKDVKLGIEPAEQREVKFRADTIAQLGFKATLRDQNTNHITYTFKVR